MSDIEELLPPSSEPALSEPPSGGCTIWTQTISPHSLLDDYMSNPSTNTFN